MANQDPRGKKQQQKEGGTEQKKLTRSGRTGGICGPSTTTVSELLPLSDLSPLGSKKFAVTNSTLFSWGMGRVPNAIPHIDVM